MNGLGVDRHHESDARAARHGKTPLRSDLLPAPYDWGSLYFDEAQLVEIMSPGLVARTLNVAPTESGQVEISFATQAGANNEVRHQNAWSFAT